MTAPIGAVLLAAGLSSRMGQPKPLLPWKNGETLLSHILKTAQRAGIAPIVVVTGHAAEQVNVIAQIHGAQAAHNTDYAKLELLSSLKVGLRALPENCPATLVMLADQPLIEVETLQHIITAWQAERPAAVAPTYRGQRGHPVLFSREFWPELLALPDGSAPREVLARHRDRLRLVPVESASVITDLDTLEDYHRALHG